jgi:hypothetical protein
MGMIKAAGKGARAKGRGTRRAESERCATEL